MALKTIRIRLKSVEQALDEAISTMKAIEKGKKVKPRKGEYFESLEAVRSLLTENRLSLLRLIRKHKPDSVAELARLAKRDFKHVYGDVELLQDLGLVHSTVNKQGKPTRLTSDTTEIVFKIAV
jgi:predicted transcriptional regulator